MERVYTIPLGDAYKAPRNKRVPRAVNILRQFAQRHMKARNLPVKLSDALNKHLWSKSIQKPPRRVKVRLLKKEDAVYAYLSDEVIEKPKEAEKQKEAPVTKKEDKKEEKTKVEASEKNKDEKEKPKKESKQSKENTHDKEKPKEKSKSEKEKSSKEVKQEDKNEN